MKIVGPELGWLTAIRGYLIAAAVCNMFWEFAQLPLYTIWHTGTAGENVFAALHCTAGDMGIAAASLVAGLALFGSPRWPESRFAPVLITVAAFGVAYTAYSEHLNTAVRQEWTYSALMPVMPGLRIGLAPLAQWLVIPAVSLVWARRQALNQIGPLSVPE